MEHSLNDLTVAELLRLHVGIGEQLRTRGITRGEDVPTGDLAEFLFCRAYGWEQAGNSEKAFDATDSEGRRYQIKGRRIHNAPAPGSSRPYATSRASTFWQPFSSTTTTACRKPP